MAKTVIGAEVEVKTDTSEKSVGSLRKQLKDATNDVQKLSEQFGITSKEAAEAAKKVAGLKDAIGDAAALSDAFNPDRKFQAFSAAIQSVVGGFTALTGAQALFGEQSEDVTKVLAKVQGALALSQGVNSILEAKDSFKVLAAVIKSQVITSLTTLRGALIATGIGAFAVGIGLVIANFEKIKEALFNLIPGLKQFTETVGVIIDKVKGWFGITEDQIDSQQALADATKEVSSALDEQFAAIDKVANIEKLRAQAAGANQDQLDKIEAAATEKKISNLNFLISEARKYGVLTTALEDERQKLIEKKEEDGLKTSIRVFKEREAAAKEAADKAKAAADKAAEEEKKRLQSIEDFKKKLRDDVKKSLEDGEAEGLAQAQAFDQLQLDVAQAQSDARLQISIDAAKREKELKDQQIADDKARNEQRVEQLSVIGNATNALSQIIGKQTAVGKGLAVAASLINTYQGATEVLRAKSTLPEPFGTISKVANVALILKTGFSAIKSILATKVPGGGGGGVSAPSGISAPLQPQVQGTNLSQNSINQLSSATNRAFVLESDVSGNQERIRRLNRAARIN